MKILKINYKKYKNIKYKNIKINKYIKSFNLNLRLFK